MAGGIIATFSAQAAGYYGMRAGIVIAALLIWGFTLGAPFDPDNLVAVTMAELTAPAITNDSELVCPSANHYGMLPAIKARHA